MKAPKRMSAEYYGKLTEIYLENKAPSSRITPDPNAVRGFRKEFNRRFGTDFSDLEISMTLEHMRKTPRDTGGLPNMGRSYSGPIYYDN